MRPFRIAGGLCILALLTTLAGCQKPSEFSFGPPPIPDDAPDFTETASGLKFRILRKSDAKKPTATDTVFLHYRGWLDSGKEFDRSYREGKPDDFRLYSVIPGWTEGLQLIGEGGMIELDVPAKLGYGKGGGGRIPPNSRLHFLIELVKVKSPRSQ